MVMADYEVEQPLCYQHRKYTTLNNSFCLFVITGVSCSLYLVSGGYKINWRFMSARCCFTLFKRGEKKGVRS